MTLTLPYLKTVPIRLFARFLSFYSALRFGTEQENLQLLLACLPQPKEPLQDKLQTKKPSVLIVIPFRDKWELTGKCIASLMNQKLDEQNIKIALVNNNSIEKKTLEKLPLWQTQLRNKGLECDVIDDPAPFNFSRLNNRAVQLIGSHFEADLILFLNNDVEFTAPDQLSAWSHWHHAQASVGISGATLIYPNRTIQHACVLPGFKIVAVHPLRHSSEALATTWSSTARCVPAVTGAALMIRSSLFRDFGGFDENLAHACQDIDLCLKSIRAGYENWTAPNLKLIHHESATRRSEHKAEEVKYFYAQWEDTLEDLCRISGRMSRWTEKPCLSWGEGAFPWRKFQE